jgi:excisionase family DNA binding protein
MPIALVHPDIKKLAAAWRKEANDLREATQVNPIADVTAYRAKQLEDAITAIEQSTKTFSTREYARIHHVQAGTVRKWIDAGELDATKNGAGDWDIPRTAVRKRKRKSA